MAVPATVYFLLAFTLPESPRYLVSIDAGDRAKRVLESIFIEPVEAKLAAIRESIDTEAKPTLADLRAKGSFFLPIVWIGLALAVFQQFVGINAVFYYSNLIWESVGYPPSEAFTTSTIISMVNVVFTVVAILLVDRIGRKPLLLVGSVGMAVSLAVIAWVFVMAPQSASGTPDLSATQGYVAVVALCGFVAFFAATWGPIVWVLLSEMFPNSIRAAAMSITVMANWIANFIVSELFPELVGISLGLAYGLFTLFAVLSFFFVWKWVTETRGTELEEMDELEGIELDDDAAAPA
jgi:SP family sugar:H+ symporter-like MFS transporter